MNSYSTSYTEWSAQIWPMCNKGITQFYLPSTHEPYLSLLPSRKALPFSWYLLHLPTREWPGWVELNGWLHTEINVPHHELNPDTVSHPSTNRVRRQLTSLIKTNMLPRHQTTIIVSEVVFVNSCSTVVFCYNTVWLYWWSEVCR